MKNKTFILIVVMGIISLLAGCVNENSKATNTENSLDKTINVQESKIKELEKQNEVLQEKVNIQDLDLKYSNDEKNYYKGIIQELTANLNDSELVELAKKQWEYDLTANNQIIPKNGKIQIEENTIEISLTQKQSAFNILPNDIFMKGKISGDYNEHLQTINPKPNDTSWTDGTVNTSFQIKFSDVKGGSEINFSITDELRERLDLDTNQISIIRK